MYDISDPETGQVTEEKAGNVTLCKYNIINAAQCMVALTLFITPLQTSLAN